MAGTDKEDMRMRKEYMDEITIDDAFKYMQMGLVAVTGNGHVYGFIMPKHEDQTEEMRKTYDACIQEVIK